MGSGKREWMNGMSDTVTHALSSLLLSLSSDSELKEIENKTQKYEVGQRQPYTYSRRLFED